jgi:lysozyme
MKMNRKGLELIKRYEGYSDKAYLCPANVWTIGYGSTRLITGLPVKKGDRINLSDAEKLLIKETSEFAKGVTRLLIGVQLNENQFSALVSFAYNLGLGNLEKSTLLKIIKADPNSQLIQAQFLRWNKANGKVLNGLTNRRKEESQLYFTRV